MGSGGCENFSGKTAEHEKENRDGITEKRTNNRCSSTSLCVEEHPEGSKKDFALYIKNSKSNEYLAYYFACYENKEQQFINNLSTKKFIKMFEM